MGTSMSSSSSDTHTNQDKATISQAVQAARRSLPQAELCKEMQHFCRLVRHHESLYHCDHFCGYHNCDDRTHNRYLPFHAYDQPLPFDRAKSIFCRSCYRYATGLRDGVYLMSGAKFRKVPNGYICSNCELNNDCCFRIQRCDYCGELRQTNIRRPREHKWTCCDPNSDCLARAVLNYHKHSRTSMLEVVRELLVEWAICKNTILIDCKNTNSLVVLDPNQKDVHIINDSTGSVQTIQIIQPMHKKQKQIKQLRLKPNNLDFVDEYQQLVNWLGPNNFSSIRNDMMNQKKKQMGWKSVPLVAIDNYYLFLKFMSRHILAEMENDIQIYLLSPYVHDGSFANIRKIIIEYLPRVVVDELMDCHWFLRCHPKKRKNLLWTFLDDRSLGSELMSEIC